MDIKKCYCKGDGELDLPFLPLAACCSTWADGTSAFTHCQGLIYCQIIPQVPKNMSWCKTLPVLAGWLLLMPCRICKHQGCASVPGHHLQSRPEEQGLVPTSYRFVQSRIHFFTVGACEIQCHNICICFSEVFSVYTAWPLRHGSVPETCMMGCDSAGVFLGKFWEIHLIPASTNLLYNLLIIKVTTAI